MSVRQPWQEALYRAGYDGCVGDEIPDWVDAVWMGYSVRRSMCAFDAINTAGPEFKDKLDAAHRLGGEDAVRALVDALLAQGVET